MNSPLFEAIVNMLIVYGIGILVAPIIIIMCINGFLSQIKKIGDITWRHSWYIDMTGKSYFCLLVLVIVGFMI